MADAKPKTGKYKVAAGRTLSVGGSIARDAQGIVTGSTPGVDAGPGSEVELEEGEAQSLIAAGFIDNPNADAPVILTGPKIQRTEG